MEATADDIRLAVANGVLTPPEEATRKIAVVSRTMVWLKRDKAARFAARLAKLLLEIDAAEGKDGDVQVGAAAAFFPMKLAAAYEETQHGR